MKPHAFRLHQRLAPALLLAAAWPLASAFAAERAMHQAGTAQVRTTVLFATLGIDDVSIRSNLLTLLRTELEQAGLLFVEAHAQEPLAEWVAELTTTQGPLAVLLLDGRAENGWKLVIIDAARGRAIAREIPEDPRRDPAAVEAVVSIASSAALALREGLEVASATVSAVVGAPVPPEAVPSPAETERSMSPSPVVAPRWSPRASAGMIGALFAPTAPVTPGLSLAVGARLHPFAELRLLGSVFSAPTLRSPLGSFRVARAWMGASGAAVLGSPAFSLSPEAGFVVERSRRFDALPSAGSVVTESAALYRAGALLSVRVRYTLTSLLAAELVTGAVYFGRSLRFTAASRDAAWSEDAWRMAAFAQLGVQLGLE